MKRLLKYLPLLLLLNSCWKEVSPDINISVSGYVVDSVKNKNMKNVKVVILGYKYSICLMCFSQQNYDTIKSISTNNDGTFSTSFITDGKEDAYRIFVTGTKSDNYIPLNSHRGIDLKIGSNSNIRLQVREFTKLKAHIIVNNYNYDTLELSDNNYYNFLRSPVFYHKHSIDTVLITNVLPMTKVNFIFSKGIYYTNNELWRLTLDTISVTNEDTTYYSKTINTLQLKKE